MPRRKTGLKRPIQVPVFFNEKEYKALRRASANSGRSMTEILRMGISDLFTKGTAPKFKDLEL